MVQKKDLRFLIDRIKAATGLKQEQIAEEINYSAAHFSVMKKSSTEELYNLLAKHFEKPLKSLRNVEELSGEIPSDEETESDSALLQALANMVTEMYAVFAGISEDGATDQLTQHAKAILKQRKMMKKLKHNDS